MLAGGKTYEALRDSFVWDIPACYNIGVDISDKWAGREPERVALICADERARVTKSLSARFAISRMLAPISSSLMG